VILDQGGLPISLGADYQQYDVELNPGGRLYLYSDGVTEAMNAEREMFGQQRLLQSLEKMANLPLSASVTQLIGEIHLWRGGKPIRDDVSILALECAAPATPV
jgi:sigma-B regulation protein RsbU (phosphoserine phosphatase)